MFRRFIPAAIALAAGAATAAVVATPAHAAATTKLYLAVRAENGTRTTATLTCNPAGGTHPDAADACAELTPVRGNIAKLPEGEGMCAMIYAPVTATAYGRWQGRSVQYRTTFGNACEMGLKTGSVFRF